MIEELNRQSGWLKFRADIIHACGIPLKFDISIHASNPINGTWHRTHSSGGIEIGLTPDPHNFTAAWRSDPQASQFSDDQGIHGTMNP